MEIPIQKISPGMARRKLDDETQLGFGVIMSNHMFMMDYNLEKKWHDPRIEPYGPLHLYPAAAILHYAQEAFEGLKAYRSKTDEIYLFRPKDNLKRMSRTCDRMCIPPFSEELVLEGLRKLLAVDRDWIPSSPGTSLYIRPNVVATEAFIGVRPAHEYLFYIITGPVGAYYPEGFAPVKIMVEDSYSRAAPGGVGGAKTAGNYGATLKGQIEAHDKGYSQVLWLDSRDHQYVEEVGTTNIFFKLKDELVTPPLAGTILPGITRDSVITLAKDIGLNVQERAISIDEIVSAIQVGELEEVFCSGTAAVISPVSVLHFKGQDYGIGNGKDYLLAQELFDTLIAIQYGEADDPHGWREKVA